MSSIELRLIKLGAQNGDNGVAGHTLLAIMKTAEQLSVSSGRTLIDVTYRRPLEDDIATMESQLADLGQFLKTLKEKIQ